MLELSVAATWHRISVALTMRENELMRIELLYIDDCPNSAGAQERLEAALEILGRGDIPVHMRQLNSASETEDTGFAGSPTITVDGKDIFPTGATADDLACRVYVTPHGLTGMPTVEQVTGALKNHGF
ncbi:thioredoxin family protein [Paenarthrobacter nitroguajacolicus]